jgi:deferrochelatase/peroxidase EfeB
MSTTEDIRKWFDDGTESGYDFMLIVCAENSENVFPVYTHVTNHAQRIAEYESMKHKVLESYDLSVDIDLQIRMKRAYFGVNTPNPNV